MTQQAVPAFTFDEAAKTDPGSQNRASILRLPYSYFTFSVRR
jgi:hypothetical protein